MATDDFMNGSIVAKGFAKLSHWCIPAALVLLCSGRWGWALTMVPLYFGLVYVSYLAAGGARNPNIYENLLDRTELTPRLRIAVCLIRLGVAMAAVDGRVDPSEIRAIKQFFVDRNADAEFLAWVDQQIIASIKHLDIPRTIREIRLTIDKEDREVLLVTLLSIAAADGGLHIKEADFLTRIAFDLGFSPEEIRRIVREAVGGEQDPVNDDDDDDVEEGSQPAHSHREAAFAALGLPSNADPAEVRRAYRTLAHRYHPDKVSHLGPEFEAVARERMTAINAAYAMIVPG